MRRLPYSTTAVTALLGLGLSVFVGVQVYRIETGAIYAGFQKDVDDKIASIEKEITLNFEALCLGCVARWEGPYELGCGCALLPRRVPRAPARCTVPLGSTSPPPFLGEGRSVG